MNQVFQTRNDVPEETDEEENELKQLREYVSELEDTIEKEHEKSKSLNEVIIKQEKLIETLQNNKDIKKYEVKTI